VNPTTGPVGSGRVARIVLVGFMGAGKSSVGAALAGRLGWDFVDMDEEIRARTGRSIPEIFASGGEAAFRSLEDAVGADLLSRSRLVLAAGGGWAAVAGRLESLPAATVSVWLRVSPEEALRRASGQGIRRPMLETPDPLETARELLRLREPFYSVADVTLDTEGSDPQRLAVDLLRVIDGLPLSPPT
jgi:shikimate kinase